MGTAALAGVVVSGTSAVPSLEEAATEPDKVRPAAASSVTVEDTSAPGGVGWVLKMGGAGNRKYIYRKGITHRDMVAHFGRYHPPTPAVAYP